jgi:glycosyltransferase involved in cell wall biosynthesis
LKKFPKISIVTPSFNQGNFIEQTILSIIKQDYPNLEYIIIDGGSTDNTLDVIKKYEKYLKYWVSEPDNGQSHALNKGFSIATGEIYAYINSDDCLYPGTLLEVAKAFNNFFAISRTV